MYAGMAAAHLAAARARRMRKSESLRHARASKRECGENEVR